MARKTTERERVVVRSLDRIPTAQDERAELKADRPLALYIEPLLGIARGRASKRRREEAGRHTVDSTLLLHSGDTSLFIASQHAGTSTRSTRRQRRRSVDRLVLDSCVRVREGERRGAPFAGA